MSDSQKIKKDDIAGYLTIYVNAIRPLKNLIEDIERGDMECMEERVSRLVPELVSIMVNSMKIDVPIPEKIDVSDTKKLRSQLVKIKKFYEDMCEK